MIKEIAKRTGRYTLMTLTENNPLLGIIAILLETITATLKLLEVYIYYFKKIVVAGKTIRQAKREYLKREIYHLSTKEFLIKKFINKIDIKELKNESK